MSAGPSVMHCFTGDASAAVVMQKFRARFLPELSDDDVVEKLIDLIDEACCNWRSVQYDTYQRMTNGIL